MLVLNFMGGGSDGGPADDQTAIENVITHTFTVNDPANCDQHYTQAFMDQLLAGTGAAALEECRENEADPDNDPAQAVSISDVTVAGGQASAVVVPTGGDMDKATVKLELVDVRGSWRLDRVRDIEIDKAAFDDLLMTRFEAEGLSRDEAGCLVREIRGEVTISEVEKAVLDGNDPPTPEPAAECLATSTLRTQLIEKSREAANQGGVPTAVTHCLMDQLEGLPDDQIRQMVNAEDLAKATMEQIMAGCAAAYSSGSA